MNAIVLYDCLADVADDLYLAVTRLEGLGYAERGVWEALWVRLDDLVEQIPPALEEAVQEARSVEQKDIRDLEKDIVQLSRQLKQAQAVT